MAIYDVPLSTVPTTRVDGKDPARTCRGLKKNGQLCSNPLAQSANRAHSSQHEVSINTINAHVASWYCWHHKNQAGRVSAKIASNVLKPQDSLDTIVHKMGLLDIKQQTPVVQDEADSEDELGKPHNGDHEFGSSARRRGAPAERRYRQTKTQRTPTQRRERNGQQTPGFWQSLVCFVTPNDNDDDRTYMEVVKRKQKTHRASVPAWTKRVDQRQSSHRDEPRDGDNPKNMASVAPDRPPHRPSFLSRHQDFIRPTLSDETSAKLLLELARPISDGDRPGYIYMFWLTDEQRAAPPESLTSSILPSQMSSRPTHKRRVSDVIKEFAETDSTGSSTVLLKIGRSNDLNRRMKEWNRQCGYKPSLIRSYPYQPKIRSDSGGPQSRDSEMKMVTNSHRVEKLIHTELACARVSQPTCGRCGRAHREWFEVDASREGLAAVDEVIRRWVLWDERRASGAP